MIEKNALVPNYNYDFNNENINVSHDWIEPFVKSYTTKSGFYTIDAFVSIDDIPAYDDTVTQTKYFSKYVVKTFDFDKYDHNVESNVYIWGEIQRVI